LRKNILTFTLRTDTFIFLIGGFFAMKKTTLIMSLAAAVGMALPGMALAVSYSAVPQASFWDFGDAPESYGTTLANNGARHADGTHEWLGSQAPDYETDGQPATVVAPPAISDDNLGPAPDDEDGVTFLGSFYDQAGTQPIASFPGFDTFYSSNHWGKVAITISVADQSRYDSTHHLYLDGWFDWGHDGHFDENGTIGLGSEHVISAIIDPTTWGTGVLIKTLDFTFLNGDGPTGPFYARFRLNFDEGANAATGVKSTGEVEDYGGCTTGQPCHGQGAPEIDAASGAGALTLLLGSLGLLAERRRRPAIDPTA
jgi:hypothetical protein